jgi:peroxiredoxin
MVSSSSSNTVNQEFLRNLFPIPASNDWSIASLPPDFELADVTNNRTVKLSDFRGKQPILLDFTRIFPQKVVKPIARKPYCPLCYPHIQALNASYEQFKAKGVEVLMITSTNAPESQTVVQDLGLKLPLLSDPMCVSFRAYQTGQALGAPLPAQFVLNQAGQVTYKHLFSFLESNASVERLLAMF